MSYRVKVKGELSDRFAAGLGPLSVERDAGHTTLVAELDQSQLYGLLERLRDLGIELVGIEEVPK